jgi:hypothetical protein
MKFEIKCKLSNVKIIFGAQPVQPDPVQPVPVQPVPEAETAKEYNVEVSLDSWETGGNFTIKIKNKTEKYINNFKIYLVEPLIQLISWVQDYKFVDGTLFPNNYIRFINPNETITISGGYNGTFPSPDSIKLDGSFEANKPLLSTPSQQIIGDIKTNHLYLVLNVDEYHSFDSDGDKEIEFIRSNNPLCISIENKKIRLYREGNGFIELTYKNKTKKYIGIFCKQFVDNIYTKRTLIGSVREDLPETIDFLRENLEIKIPSDIQKLRLNDTHYLYLNGGPSDYGWRINYSTPEFNLEPLGMRLIKFIKNCLVLGVIPCIVYYNIPAGNESYTSNKANLEDPVYMKLYYEDYLFVLNTLQKMIPDLPVFIVHEPDMISYILQNETDKPENVKCDLSEVMKMDILKVKPEKNNLPSLIKNILQITNQYKNIILLPKINLWGSLTGSNPIPGGRGIIPVSDYIGIQKGKEILDKTAKLIVKFYKDSGYTRENGIKSIAFDSYGLDGGLVTSESPIKPQNSSWFWNTDLCNNYLYFIKQCSIEYGNLPSMIWQLPVGYINNNNDINPFTTKEYSILPNMLSAGEDIKLPFLFGQSYTTNRDYLRKNDWNDPLIDIDIFNQKVTIKSHMHILLEKYNIFAVLIGAGVGGSTRNLLMASGSQTDDNHSFVKGMDYYIDFYTNFYKK